MSWFGDSRYTLFGVEAESISQAVDVSVLDDYQAGCFQAVVSGMTLCLAGLGSEFFFGRCEYSHVGTSDA